VLEGVARLAKAVPGRCLAGRERILALGREIRELTGALLALVAGNDRLVATVT
jgi:hypothetical protein